MGVETQAILPGHLSADGVAELLRNECGITRLGVRDMHRPEYKIIEFIDRAGSEQALNVFLNSYAASDYEAVYAGDSTLLTVEFSPTNYDALNAVARAAGGYIQRSSGAAWARVP